MRLDELKNDFPDIPDSVHDMIQEEVEKQVNSSNITPMQRKSKLNRSISRVAAAAAVCIIATSSFTFVQTLIKCIISSFYMCFVIDYPHNPIRS